MPKVELGADYMRWVDPVLARFKENLFLNTIQLIRRVENGLARLPSQLVFSTHVIAYPETKTSWCMRSSLKIINNNNRQDKKPVSLYRTPYTH